MLALRGWLWVDLLCCNYDLFKVLVLLYYIVLFTISYVFKLVWLMLYLVGLHNWLLLVGSLLVVCAVDCYLLGFDGALIIT